MSRSNPTQDNPNPATIWFEWNGELGEVRYYDKEFKKEIVVPQPFVFILLDELATVKGWHDPSESGIYSNEVKDTTKETFVVKAFKGGKIAEGFYAAIKDKIKAEGGHYTTNCYIGYRDGGEDLLLGSIQFKGAALMEWMEFKKQNRSELYKGAVRIKGFTEGKKGKIEFRKPKFSLVNITEETEAQAIDLDKTLQDYLKGYFAKNRADVLDQRTNHEAEDENQDAPKKQTSRREPEPEVDPEVDDDIPF